MSTRGVVSKVSSNSYAGKELWSFRLNGDNAYYNTGEKVPPVSVGDSIEFDFKLSATNKPQVIVPSIRPWKSDPTLTAAPVGGVLASGNTFKASMNDKDTYWKDKEARDIRNDEERRLGASRNTAIALVSLMLEQEALKLPANVAKREAIIWEAVSHYTDKLMGKLPTEEPQDAVAELGSPEPNTDWI